MADTAILEVSSLDHRHPELALFDECAVKLITRLSIDPTRLPSSETFRELSVEQRSRSSPAVPVELAIRVDWSALRDGLPEKCRRRTRTVNEDNLTEWAAIGIMALLIHELEDAIITSVIPKGIGSDYEVTVNAGGDEFQVEVSGIREDRSQSGKHTAARVQVKRAQLLKRQRTGFVSVTAFAYSSSETVRSYLHFVDRSQTESGKRRQSRGRKK